MLLRLFCQSPELAPSCKMPCRQFTAKPVICSSEHLREVEACGFPRARARGNAELPIGLRPDTSLHVSGQ